MGTEAASDGAAPTARIVEAITAFCGSAHNHFGMPDDEPAFAAPLVGFAAGDDPLFAELKVHVGASHWTPGEAFALAFPERTLTAPASCRWSAGSCPTRRRPNATIAGRRACRRSAGCAPSSPANGSTSPCANTSWRRLPRPESRRSPRHACRNGRRPKRRATGPSATSPMPPVWVPSASATASSRRSARRCAAARSWPASLWPRRHAPIRSITRTAVSSQRTIAPPASRAAPRRHQRAGPRQGGATPISNRCATSHRAAVRLFDRRLRTLPDQGALRVSHTRPRKAATVAGPARVRGNLTTCYGGRRSPRPTAGRDRRRPLRPRSVVGQERPHQVLPQPDRGPHVGPFGVEAVLDRKAVDDGDHEDGEGRNSARRQARCCRSSAGPSRGSRRRGRPREHACRGCARHAAGSRRRPGTIRRRRRSAPRRR